MLPCSVIVNRMQNKFLKAKSNAFRKSAIEKESMAVDLANALNYYSIKIRGGLGKIRLSDF